MADKLRAGYIQHLTAFKSQQSETLAKITARCSATMEQFLTVKKQLGDLEFEKRQQEASIESSQSLIDFLESQQSEDITMTPLGDDASISMADIAARFNFGSSRMETDLARTMMEPSPKHKNRLSDAFVLYLVGNTLSGKTMFDYAIEMVHSRRHPCLKDGKGDNLYNMFDSHFELSRSEKFSLSFYYDKPALEEKDGKEEGEEEDISKRYNWNDGLIVATCQQIDPFDVHKFSPNYAIIYFDERLYDQTSRIGSIKERVAVILNLLNNDKNLDPNSLRVCSRLREKFTAIAQRDEMDACWHFLC